MLPGSKVILTIVGVFFLFLGVFGLLLPVLPTTPFILLAAWCFSRSSPRLHRYLMENKIFGPIIENWTKYRAIGRIAKISATPFIFIFFGYNLFFTTIHHGLKIFANCNWYRALIFYMDSP